MGMGLGTQEPFLGLAPLLWCISYGQYSSRTLPQWVPGLRDGAAGPDPGTTMQPARPRSPTATRQQVQVQMLSSQVG